MLYKKEGMPEEEELVLCTVTNVQHHSVFAKLDEYDKTGMIHISEVSPGRIRNIRDFVQEGKKIVCKILNVDPVKGHIDLSLRRVNDGQKRKKMEDIKQEQRAKKIIEGVAKKMDMDLNKIYDEISSKVFEKYEYIYQFFNAVVEGQTSAEKLKIEPNIGKELEVAVKEKIKQPEVFIKGELSLTSYAEEGVEDVKEALKKVEEAGKGEVKIKYLGAGKYNVTVKSENYKEAEKLLDKAVNSAIKLIEKREGKGLFVRAG
jgi:translation initiation factor 2 subunit 1